MDISRRFRRRHLLTAFAYQPHFTRIGRTGFVGEQNSACRCDAHRSDTHGVNGCAPVKVRLIVGKRIGILRAAEMRIHVSKASNAAVSVNIESVDALTESGKSIIAVAEQRHLQSAGRNLQHLRHESIQLFGLRSLHTHCHEISGKLVALCIQRRQIICNAHVVTSTIAASAVSTPESSVSTPEIRVRISEMDVRHPCIS